MRFMSAGQREAAVETITCRNLHINDFMQQYVSGPVDYMSIDVEGLDMDVLLVMDPGFMPTIIQCEHERQTEQLARIMTARGYALLGLTDVNVIFIRNGAI
jgi:hypothetical protein